MLGLQLNSSLQLRTQPNQTAPSGALNPLVKTREGKTFDGGAESSPDSPESSPGGGLQALPEYASSVPIADTDAVPSFDYDCQSKRCIDKEPDEAISIPVWVP